MPPAERAWRDSELGEMAVRLGRDVEAEHWFQNGLRASPGDFYIRAAYADLLLRNGRTREVLTLLKGQESLKPLLLRIAIAQKMCETGVGTEQRRGWLRLLRQKRNAATACIVGRSPVPVGGSRRPASGAGRLRSRIGRFSGRWMMCWC